MDSGLKFSVIVPCYNEENNVNELYLELKKQLNFNYEIIFVDDGSTDNTLSIIKLLNEKDNRVKYISFSRNFGHQFALKAGINKADGDFVITMDCDLQHPVTLLGTMISKWQEGYEVIQTIRKSSPDLGFFKKITGYIFYKILNLLSEIKIIPGTADFRLLDRKVVLSLREFSETSLFYRGLIPWMGFRVAYIEYIPNNRFAGTSGYSFKKMLKLATAGITSFSTRPLKIAIFIGFIISFIAFIYAMYALYIYLYTRKAISGWTSLIISILFIGGLQIIFLGIIGEYLGKLFIQSKNRPSYIIRETNI